MGSEKANSEIDVPRTVLEDNKFNTARLNVDLDASHTLSWWHDFVYCGDSNF